MRKKPNLFSTFPQARPDLSDVCPSQYQIGPPIVGSKSGESGSRNRPRLSHFGNTKVSDRSSRGSFRDWSRATIQYERCNLVSVASPDNSRERRNEFPRHLRTRSRRCGPVQLTGGNCRDEPCLCAHPEPRRGEEGRGATVRIGSSGLLPAAL